MSSSNSPCAACKFLRRKCTQECVFAPYFPPDQPQKFANVHKVFGASNVAKILNELNAAQREDAVNSLAYEADARLRDPVYGCVGLISILQHRLKQVQIDLYNAKKELSTYIGPSAMLPIIHQHQGGFVPNNPGGGPSSGMPYNLSPMMCPPQNAQLVIREPQLHHHHQMLEAQQMAAAAAREQQEYLRTCEQNQQQHHQHHQQQQQNQQELMRFNNSGCGFDPVGPVGVGVSGFNNHLAAVAAAAAMSPALALGGCFDGSYQIQQQQQQQPQDQHSHSQSHHHHQLQLQIQPQQLLLHQQQQQQPQAPQQQQPQRSGSEEGRSRSVGPSS
ncbi:hypothetical protein RHMOL_Rhmol08G0120500 [Rhododendron molle]|uniref:Uncharacterized protein n=1 Tax=Rhododendron molle TaxID=49168 RepID=A0ACC0MNT1_RHOML|nr:hypothetical protein RHMOL_Rhmol08G0120500 [Rhododendron molle]